MCVCVWGGADVNESESESERESEREREREIWEKKKEKKKALLISIAPKYQAEQASRQVGKQTPFAHTAWKRTCTSGNEMRIKGTPVAQHV